MNKNGEPRAGAEPVASRSTSAYDILLNYEVPSDKKQQTTEAHDIIEKAYDKEPATSKTGAAYNLGSYAYKAAKIPETPSLDYSKYEIKESVDKFPTGALEPKPILNIPVRPVEFTEQPVPKIVVPDGPEASESSKTPEILKTPEAAEVSGKPSSKTDFAAILEQVTSQSSAQPEAKRSPRPATEKKPSVEVKPAPEAKPTSESKSAPVAEKESSKAEQETIVEAGKIIEHINELRSQGVLKEESYQRVIRKTFETFEKLSGWEKWWSNMTPAERRVVKATNDVFLTSQPNGTKGSEFSYWLISKEFGHPRDFEDHEKTEDQTDFEAAA